MKNNTDPLEIKIDENKHLLPYDYYSTVVEYGRPDVLFHWHPEVEINYIYEGPTRFHIDYDYFSSQAGDTILIRPNGIRSIRPLENQKHTADTFRFYLDMIGHSTVDQVSLRYLQPLQASLYKFVSRIQPGIEGYEDIKECLFTIFELSENEGRRFELLLKSKLNRFLYLLSYHHYVLRKNTDDAYRKNERIRGLIDYIGNNYQKNLSIDFLSRFMGYSKTHFMAIFKQHAGASCTEFTIQVRLNKACDLLINTADPILEIAATVGFNNLPNFNRQFKRYYKLTPGQYRKQFKKTHYIGPHSSRSLKN